MKIYLSRDASLENSRYIVYSETGDQIFDVCGKHKSGFERLYIRQNGDIVAKISDTSISSLRSCYVNSKFGNFHFISTLTKDRMNVTFHKVPFHLRGNVILKSYDILDVDNTVIACVQKRFKTSSETLEINISNEKYLVHCIASAVCLNNFTTTDSLALQTT